MPVSLEELQLRLKRIYSSIDATIDSDLSNLRPTEIPGGFLMNFSQGKSNEELQNMVWNMIHTTAIFFGHCKEWAKANGVPREDVINIGKTKSCCIIRDLDNREKHPHASPNTSGVSPALQNIRRSLRITSGPGQTYFTMDMLIGKRESPGSPRLVTDAEIINSKTGKIVGTLSATINDVVEQWEKLLRKHNAID